MAFAVIPMGPWCLFGRRTPLQLTDLAVGVLYILAVSSIGVYGIMLAGWAAGRPIRCWADFVRPPRWSPTRSRWRCVRGGVPLRGHPVHLGIVAAQDPPGTFLLLPSFLIYVTWMIGETNRAPFDLPEAEGELVGGFHTKSRQ